MGGYFQANAQALPVADCGHLFSPSQHILGGLRQEVNLNTQA